MRFVYGMQTMTIKLVGVGKFSNFVGAMYKWNKELKVRIQT